MAQDDELDPYVYSNWTVSHPCNKKIPKISGHIINVCYNYSSKSEDTITDFLNVMHLLRMVKNLLSLL